MRLQGRHYATGEMIEVVVESGRIVELTTLGSAAADCSVGWIAPAFFDLQINGCDGISFNSPTLTVGQLRHVVDVCRSHGISGLCPTLVTNSFDSLKHGFETLAMACREPDLDAVLPMFHLEGPYISGEDGPRGAHPRVHVRPPDRDEFQRWQDVADGRIRLVTLAPEHDGAIEFIEWLAQQGIVVAIGHTAATGQQIRAAIAAGARLSTHLGNGAHAMMPRHDNYIWEQLAADELWASLICDGAHLPPAVIKSFLRAKTPERTILTCDAGSLAGCPPGRYQDWGGEFEVTAGGRIVVPGTPFLAGSWVFTDACVGHLLHLGVVTLAEAVDMAGANPRRLLGLPPVSLTVGSRAELVMLAWSPGDALAIEKSCVPFLRLDRIPNIPYHPRALE